MLVMQHVYIGYRYQGFIRDFLLGRGEKFCHVNLEGSGGIPPRKHFWNLDSLRLILVQF